MTMTDNEIDARLRGVETQLVQLNQQLATSLTFLQALVNKHELAIYGQPGAAGIDTRTDRLEQVDAFRKRTVFAALGAAVTALAGLIGTHLVK